MCLEGKSLGGLISLGLGGHSSTGAWDEQGFGRVQEPEMGSGLGGCKSLGVYKEPGLVQEPGRSRE